MGSSFHVIKAFEPNLDTNIFGIASFLPYLCNVLFFEMRLYHISPYRVSSVKPRVPSGLPNENKRFRRICCSPTIEKGLRAINNSGLENELLFAYPFDVDEALVYNPSLSEVPDVNLTDEKWLLCEMPIVCPPALIKVTSLKYEGWAPDYFIWDWNYELLPQPYQCEFRYKDSSVATISIDHAITRIKISNGCQTVDMSSKNSMFEVLTTAYDRLKIIEVSVTKAVKLISHGQFVELPIHKTSSCQPFDAAVLFAKNRTAINMASMCPCLVKRAAASIM